MRNQVWAFTLEFVNPTSRAKGQDSFSQRRRIVNLLQCEQIQRKTGYMRGCHRSAGQLSGRHVCADVCGLNANSGSKDVDLRTKVGMLPVMPIGVDGTNRECICRGRWRVLSSWLSIVSSCDDGKDAHIENRFNGMIQGARISPPCRSVSQSCHTRRPESSFLYRHLPRDMLITARPRRFLVRISLADHCNASMMVDMSVS